jgi:hypothetical protein
MVEKRWDLSIEGWRKWVFGEGWGWEERGAAALRGREADVDWGNQAVFRISPERTCRAT